MIRFSLIREQNLDSSPEGVDEEPQDGGGHRLAANRIPF